MARTAFERSALGMQSGDGQDPPRTISDRERWAFGAMGAALALYGLRCQGWARLASMAAGGGLLYQGIAGESPIYRVLGIRLVPTRRGHRVEVIRSTTIARPVEELYRFWRNFENLPDVMPHLQAVRMIDERRSHWTATGLAGRPVEWRAEIVNEQANGFIAWQTYEGSDIAHWGVIRFAPAPGDRGTEVTIEMEYDPAAGASAAAIAKLFGREPGQQIDADLRRFKQLMEAGEVATTEGQPVGAGRIRKVRRTDARLDGITQPTRSP